MDSGITQLKVQGPSMTCDESQEVEEEDSFWGFGEGFNSSVQRI